MRWLIASDLHGAADCCAQLLRAFEREKADCLLLLGDILYHGPRNDLPEDYAPKRVIPQLNALSERILCIRGNCDAEVDGAVLTFPLVEQMAIADGGLTILVTHGHVFSDKNPPPMAPGSLLLFGHTHVPLCERRGTTAFLNPGSVSIPKQGSRRGYMTLEDRVFCWKMLDGKTFITEEF